MESQDKSQRQLAVYLAHSATDTERAALLQWVQGLLEIRDSSLPTQKKAAHALKLTANSKVVWPTAKLIGREIKRLAWDQRGLKGRLSLGGIAIGATVFAGQGAGIAALGTAIGVPLWVVLGAGGAFAGMLIEELNLGRRSKTGYTVIDAEREDE